MKTAGILFLGSVLCVLTGCQSEQSQLADNAAATRPSDTVADFPILPLDPWFYLGDPRLVFGRPFL